MLFPLVTPLAESYSVPHQLPARPFAGTADEKVRTPYLYINHSCKGMPIYLIDGTRKRKITAREALDIATHLAVFAAVLYFRERLPVTADSLSTILPTGLTPQNILPLAQGLLRSADCELSSSWE